MRKYSIDTTLRVRIEHRAGALANIARVIGETGGLIGAVSIVSYGEEHTIRELVVETADDAHTEKMVEAVRALPKVEVLDVRDAVFERHRGGKLSQKSMVPLKDVSDLRTIYTPGVARVSRAIAKDPALAWDYTGIGNSVGIFTNGSRVLGLGDIGPLASMPVMEGKAVLYREFAGISATPILINTYDPKEFVRTVCLLSKTFGAIHLEDIRIPECFEIERELKRLLKKPVMHDDQHGTATVALSAMIVACRNAGVNPRDLKLGQIGLGAAGSAIARLARSYGMREVLVTDVSEVAVRTLEAEGAKGTTLDGLLAEADIVVATTGKPGLISAAKIRKGQIVFALSNPDPEIQPADARRAGAAFAADGRTVNNALAFPGIFKGALSVRSSAITVEMMIAAAEALAECAKENEVTPNPLDPAVHEAVTKRVAEVARSQGLAGLAEI